MPNVEADSLLPWLKQRVLTGTIVCSDTFESYTGVPARGYVHRLVRHEQQEYSDGQGNHINGLEGFWGYSKRMIASKGEIRRNLCISTFPILSGSMITEGLELGIKPNALHA